MHKRLHLFDGDLRLYFRKWFAGDIAFGDYFEYVSEYLKHRFSQPYYTVLYYEDMVRDIRPNILKIAEFLDNKYVDRLLANNECLLNLIIDESGVDKCKHFYGKDDIHFRKGVVGDWRSHLTREESDLIDLKFKDTFAGTELEFKWESDMKWISKY